MRCNREKIILSFNIAAFNDSDGKLCGFIVSFRDITGMRHMEAALKKADRLAALGELSARMAHEIRNPLAALCGSVQLLSNATYIKANDAELLSIVNREAERLEALITEFLMYARPSNPVISEVSLHMFIEGELSFFEKNIRFMPIKMKNMVPESIKIAIDSNQIHQVFLNLLQNAAEAMIGDNREIVVEASSTPELLTISITDNYWYFSRISATSF
jgi:two-component system sensor histidine kinase PilS (NtrC family)